MCMSLSRRLLLPCALVGAVKKVAPFIQICTAGFQAISRRGMSELNLPSMSCSKHLLFRRAWLYFCAAFFVFGERQALMRTTSDFAGQVDSLQPRSLIYGVGAMQSYVNLQNLFFIQTWSFCHSPIARARGVAFSCPTFLDQSLIFRFSVTKASRLLHSLTLHKKSRSPKTLPSTLNSYSPREDIGSAKHKNVRGDPNLLSIIASGFFEV